MDKPNERKDHSQRPQRVDGQTAPLLEVIDFRSKPDDIDLSQHKRPAGTPAPTLPESDNDPLVLNNCLATQPYTGHVSTVQAPPKLTKPGKDRWFRVHHDPAQHFEIRVIEDPRPMNGKLHVVSLSLNSELSPYITRRKIYRCVDTYGVEFHFAVRLPGSDGELDSANKDKHIAAEIAKKYWTLIVWDQEQKAYCIKKADDPDAPEPKWAERTPEQCFELLFADAQIRSLDHPVAQFLLGKRIS